MAIADIALAAFVFVALFISLAAFFVRGNGPLGWMASFLKGLGFYGLWSRPALIATGFSFLISRASKDWTSDGAVIRLSKGLFLFWAILFASVGLPVVAVVVDAD